MGTDWSIDVPAGWERLEPPAELLLAARSPDATDGFRPNLTVAAQARDVDEPDAYIDATARVTFELLDRPRFLEARRQADSEPPAWGFLIAHVFDGYRLTVEQRHVWVPDGVVVASFTCATREFWQLHGTAVEILQSLEVEA